MKVFNIIAFNDGVAVVYEVQVSLERLRLHLDRDPIDSLSYLNATKQLISLKNKRLPGSLSLNYLIVLDQLLEEMSAGGTHNDLVNVENLGLHA